MTIDQELYQEFINESYQICLELNTVLEETEDSPDLYHNLEKYGQMVDRIMGGAKTIAESFSSDFPADHLIHRVGDYSALCKSIGYKASQIRKNDYFFNVCVACLMDATNMLKKMLGHLQNKNQGHFNIKVTDTFMDQLRWINSQFKGNVRGSVASTIANNDPSGANVTKPLEQTDIDDLLKKIGAA